MDHNSVNIEAGREDAGKFDSHHHKSLRWCFSGATVKVALLFVLMAITCLILLQSLSPTEAFRQFSYNNVLSWRLNQASASSSLEGCHSISPQENEEKNRLRNTLKKATMADGKTVIVTSLNAAWTMAPNSIFDLFLESFRIGNQTQGFLKHIVVGALDHIAYTRCMATDELHCFAVTTAGVNFTSEAPYMTDEYLKMVLKKIDFLRSILELGFDFIFTDVDVLWLRNPLDRLYPDVDFQASCDHFWLPTTDRGNLINTGFHYVKSNNRTIELYKYWYASRDYFPKKHDQDLLNIIKFNPFLNEIGITMRFHSTEYFGGFCEPKQNIDVAVTMHAICCIGQKDKFHDLNITISDWKKYRAGTLKSWNVPQRCHA